MSKLFEHRAEEILNEIDGMIENLEEAQTVANKEEHCFEYQAELKIEIIEKAMLIINYMKER